MILHGRALVIGGTGMLDAATRWIVGRSADTLLVARHASRYAAGLNERITPLDTNWDRPSFTEHVTEALAASTPPTICLLWLHQPDPILPWLLPLLSKARTVLVLGSLDGQPLPGDYASPVVTVRLGSVAVGARRRWLTEAEISDAAITALTDGISRVVGDLQPLN